MTRHLPEASQSLRFLQEPTLPNLAAHSWVDQGRAVGPATESVWA
ncbi:MAG: hypothetical protein Q6K80_06225 [Thermostichus sp. DG_1_6_bins_120]